MADKIKCILTIAGSDSGAGAGIQSDLKTFKNHGLYGLTVITTVTAQNTLGVSTAQPLKPGIVSAQLGSVLSDFKFDIVKIGVIGEPANIQTISSMLGKIKNLKLVVDPVVTSKNNFLFTGEAGLKAMKKYLFKITYLLTPNLHEARLISDINIHDTASLEKALKKIFSFGCKNVLIKGGHFDKLKGIPPGTDILYNGKKFISFSGPFIKTKNTHGIGCTFSASIASNLALGKSLVDSISDAKKYVIKTLQINIKVGTGYGPLEV